jgi:cell division initiation protein
MNISPLDIQQQQFKGRIFGGLDPDEVDSFLQQVSQDMELLIRENNDLKEQNRKALSELEEMNDREKALRETMLAAHRITEDMKSNAKKEATLIITEAELEGEKLLASAEARLVELRAELQEMRRQKQQFEASFKSLLDNHSKMLSITDE